jgi:hypothetical protein
MGIVLQSQLAYAIFRVIQYMELLWVLLCTYEL